VSNFQKIKKSNTLEKKIEKKFENKKCKNLNKTNMLQNTKKSKKSQKFKQKQTALELPNIVNLR
jgi:hypothetical protein